jgi:hypothetical protein
MGHFTINLPGNRQGDVRWGKVRKLQLPFLWLTKKNKDIKTGYLVKITPAFDSISEYKLFKSNEGKWSQDPDGRIEMADKMAIVIKEAIEQREQTIEE